MFDLGESLAPAHLAALNELIQAETPLDIRPPEGLQHSTVHSVLNQYARCVGWYSLSESQTLDGTVTYCFSRREDFWNVFRIARGFMNEWEPAVVRLISLLRRLSADECLRVCALHKAWNSLLIKREQLDDQQVIAKAMGLIGAVRHIRSDDWQRGMEWLRRHYMLDEDRKRYPFLTSEYADICGNDTGWEEPFFPWEDVEASRSNPKLQTHVVMPRSGERRCPRCYAPSETLTWFYFRKWAPLAGRAGPMSICEQCHIQVQFELTVMS